MSPVSQSKPSNAKVQKHRERMRARGMRPVQIWVPDVRSPAFKLEARRQSLVVANSEGEKEDQAFIDSVADRGDE